MNYRQLGNNVWCDGRMFAMCYSADDARMVLEALRGMDDTRELHRACDEARACARAWKRAAKNQYLINANPTTIIKSAMRREGREEWYKDQQNVRKFINAMVESIDIKDALRDKSNQEIADLLLNHVWCYIQVCTPMSALIEEAIARIDPTADDRWEGGEDEGDELALTPTTDESGEG